jgi:hypothetical protein
VTDTNYNFKIGDLFIDCAYNTTLTGLIFDITETEEEDRIKVKWISKEYEMCYDWQYSRSELEAKMMLRKTEYYPVIQYEKKCI